MKKVLLLCFWLISSLALAQSPFTAGNFYTTTPTSGTPSATGSRIRIDLSNGWIYQWNPVALTWQRVGQGIDIFASVSDPAYAPTGNMSWFVVNDLDKFFKYSGSGTAWDCLNCYDVTFAGDLTGNETSQTVVALQGRAVSATAPGTGEVLKWNGTSWVPSADLGTTYTGGAGIDVTGTVITNTGDLSATNEIQALTAGDGAGDNKTLDLSLSGGTVTLDPAGILTISRSGNTLTLTATEIDGSVTNELQTYAHSGTTSYTNTLSSGGGSFTLQASGIAAISHTAGTVTITATEVDGSVTNEIQTITAGDGAGDNKTLDLSLSGGTITFDPAGALTLSRSGNTLTFTVTEVDGSITNEGALTVNAGSGTTSVISSNTSGSTDVTLTAAGILAISESGNTITLTATEVDGSVSNEGSLTVAAGTGTTSIINSNTSGQTGVTLTAAGALSISESGNVITLTATEVDGSVTNEGSLTVNAGSGTTSVISSNTSGSTDVTLTAAGILAISESGNTITLTATEVDGSVTNEAWTVSDGSNTELISNQTVVFSGSGGAVVSYNPTTNTVTINAGSSSGGDNWGSQVVQHDASLAGDGTSGDALGIEGYAAASNGEFPSKSVGGITWQTVDLSETNEIQTISAGDGAGDNKTIDLSLSGGTVTLDPAGILAITRSGNTLTMTATEVDGSVTNEVLTISDGTDSEALGGQTLNVAASGIASVDYVPGTNTLTIGAVEVDGSTSNELQTYSHSGTTSYTNTLSSGGGSFTLQASGIAAISHTTGTVTITATEVDGSVTNEAWTIDGDDADTEVISNQTVKFQGGGITTTDYNPATDVLLITSTEVDGSVTNEGSLTVNAGSGTTSVISSNTSGSTDVTLTAAGILAISESGNTITFTATEVDGSVTNEAWTVSDGTNTEVISNQTVVFTGSGGAVVSYNPTTNTVTVNAGSSSGGDNWGSQVVQHDASLAGDGTGGDVLGIDGYGAASNGEFPSKSAGGITWQTVDLSETNEIQTISAGDGTGDNKTIDLSLSGGTVTLDPAGIFTISRSGNTLTMTATEVDGSVTNEAWTIDGDDADTEVISNQTVKFQGAGITTTDYNATTDVLLITSTEVDGSTTNEIQTITAGDGAGDNKTLDLSLSGGTVTLDPAGILAISRSGNTLTLTATEVDGSTTNEVLTISDGTDSEALGGQTLTVSGSGIVTADYVIATNTLTITGTEVDGSVSNEGSLTVAAGTGTTSIINSNTSGQTGVTLTAAGALSISESGNTITLTATEVDGSVTNEGSLTVNAGSGTTSIISSNTSGSTDVTLTAAGILAISESGNTITLTATEVDGSTTNEVLTISDGTDSEALGGQTLTVSGSGIVTADYVIATNTLTITGTEVDGSTTNEIQTISAGDGTGDNKTLDLSLSGGTVTLDPAGIFTISRSGNTLTMTATEVDGSVSNEGSLTVNAGSGTTSVISSNTSGSTDVTLTAGSGISISESGNNITISATAGGSNYQVWRDDGADATTQPNANFVSNSDIAFTLANDAGNSETEITADIPAGAVDLSEIQNISTGVVLGRSTASSGVTEQITVSTGLSISGGNLTATDASATNEAWTIDGDDADTELITTQTVKFQGAGIAVTDYNATTDVLLITATEVDGSVSNEGSLTVAAGTGTTSIINSNTSGQTGVTLTAAGALSISESGNVITLTATEVDGSITNEGSLTVNAGSGTTSVISSNTSGSTDVTLTAAGILAISESGNTITLTATEVDGSTTNEVLTISDGTDSEALGGQTLTVSATGIATVDYVPGTNTLTIGATEIDGSTTNEAWTIDGDDADTEVISNQTVKFQGAGITATDYDAATNVLLITSTEVDGSISNEGSLTVAAGTGTTSIINSNTSGQTGVTLTAAGALSISESGNVITITATEVDGSVSNEGSLTVNAGTGTTSIISSNTSGSTDVTLTAGSGISISETGNNITIAATGGGGGAPTDAQYLTLATNGTLTDERVLTAGVNVTTTDAGAGGALTVSAFDGSQTTSQFTADQDNFTPTNWSTRTNHYVSSDATIRAITGFGDLPDNTVRRIINTGTKFVYVPVNHPDSDADQRVAGDADWFIEPNGGVLEIFYDAGSAVWRVLRSTFNPALLGPENAGQFFYAQPASTNASDQPFLAFTGTNQVDEPTAGGLPVAWGFSTASSATGSANVYFPKNVLEFSAFGAAHLSGFAGVYVPTLSTAAQRYEVVVSLTPNASTTVANVNNSVGFRYRDDLNGGEWLGYSRDNAGTEATLDCNIAVATNTVYWLAVYVDKARSEARYFINHQFIGRITNNLPNNVITGFRVNIIKSVGTTARILNCVSLGAYSIY